MEYKLCAQFDISIKKIANGFTVQIQNPDIPSEPVMFFASELDAYEFAALELGKLIEGMK